MKFIETMIQKSSNFPSHLIDLFINMGFYLMIGMFFAGLLHILITKERITKHLGAESRFAVIKASLLGVPLPLCSCGVVPTAVGISKNGASIGAVTSFLISTPQTGIDSIIATGGMMGPVFAIFRPIAAFLSGIIGGTVLQLTMGKKKIVFEEAHSHCSDESCSDSSCSTTEGECQDGCGLQDSHIKKETIPSKVKKLFQFGFIEFLDDIAIHMIVGLLIAAAIRTFIDPELVKSLGITEGLPAMIIMIIIGLPMYICATSSIPLGLSFLALGFSPGAVFVFLFAGPVTNAASIGILARTLGKKATAIYIVTVSVLAIVFGLIFDLLINLMKIDFNQYVMGHDHQTAQWKTILMAGMAIIFGLLLFRAIAVKWFKKLFRTKKGVSTSKELTKEASIMKFSVKGMSCQHCVANVTKAIKNLQGVASVDVLLEQEIASVIGSKVSPKKVISAIEKVGYKAEQIE